MKRKWFLSPLFLVIAIALAGATYAQSGSGYDLPWWSIDGGGATAIQSGAYTWRSTAGQPDAGTLSEGTYTFRGGFWGGVFSPTTYISTQSGAWDTLTTWEQAAAPGYNAIVTIRAGDTVTVSSAAQGYRLIVEHGATLVILEDATLTMRNRVVNAGTLRQTRTVDGSVPVAFLTFGDHRGVDLATGNDLGSVTVTVQALDSGESCTADGVTSPPYAQRCFRIQPTHNLSATVRLWARAGEVAFPGTPAVFHNPGGTDVWTELTANAGNGASGDSIYAEADTPGFSYFLVAQSGQAPTRLGPGAFIARGNGIIGALCLAAAFFILLHKRK